MLSIRHLQTGSIIGHALAVARRSLGSMQLEFAILVPEENLDYKTLNIDPSEVGWMTPSNKARKHHQFTPDLSLTDGRQYSIVTHPLTGCKQRSVVHTSLSGTIDAFEPDLEYHPVTLGSVDTKYAIINDDHGTSHFVVFDTNQEVLRWFITNNNQYSKGPYGTVYIHKTDTWLGLVACGAIYMATWRPVYVVSLGYRDGSHDYVARKDYFPDKSWPDIYNPPPPDFDVVETRVLNGFGPSITYPNGWPIGAKESTDFPDRETLVRTLNGFVSTFTFEYERVVYPQVREGYRAACTDAIGRASFIQSNQLEFWKDVGMTFSEFGALKTFAENLAERIVAAPSVKQHAKNICRQIKKRHDILYKRKFGSIDTAYALSDAEVSRWYSQRYLSDLVGGQISDSANTYLAHYYGTRLAVADIEEMSQGLSKFIWTYYSEFRKRARTLHSHMDFNWSTKYGPSKTYLNYNLVYNPYGGISELHEIVNELGFSVNFHQVWECIPLSFVVDWVFNITDVLKAIDLQNELTKLDIYYEGISALTQMDVSEAVSTRYGWNCNLEYEYYERLYNPLPTIIPGAINLIGKPQRHFIQGAALLCSR